jgi:5,10-methylenetetrahydromethanopterin reductase
MNISCAFATGTATPDHIAEAERLGYVRAWIYDSPALYTDAWMTLAIAAGRTSTIGLGPAVLIPTLRHPMVNASAVATLAALAPGRVSVAVGAGFTGRYTMGQKPLRWSKVEEYVAAVRGLLRGDAVEWEGAPIRMLHPAGFGAARPIDVPFLIGADGPKGSAVAERVGDGIFAAAFPNPRAAGRPHVLLQFGTVLDEEEEVRSRRVLDAAGPAVAVLFHATYERGGADAVRGLPGGDAWVKAIEAIPARERHLTTHEGHLVTVTDLDEAAVIQAADLIPAMSFSGTPEVLRNKVAELESIGVTEIAYQPAGPEIAAELTRMAAALQL